MAKKASPKEIKNGLIGGAIVLVLCCGGITSFFGDDAQSTPTKPSTTTPARPNNIAELPATPTSNAGAERDAAEASAEADRKRQAQEAEEEERERSEQAEAERERAKQRKAEEETEQEEEADPEPQSAYYANCSAARAAGAAPLYRGDPGYRKALDRDGDGDACE